MAEQEVTITVTPDPLWTAEDEAAAQFWLDLIRRAQQQDHG
jgi:hypothetical protein